ncbi:MAG: hypothetical protein IKI58_03600 [Oscillospiraceae bacterium]|nr:hypothetical protein [Oscillospiraceae bacterium]
MKLVFVCPMDDTIQIGGFDLYGENRIHAAISFQNYIPPEQPVYPYVPAYFQNYNYQRLPLRKFLRETISGLRPRNYLLALHDDATDLEAHALSELLIACGAKETMMEYRAFLLSSEDAYIAVTGSKRAVAVTLVRTDREETERIFIPISDATPEMVQDAVHDLDPDGTLPVYRFGVPDPIREANVGEPVNANEIVRNFVRIL